MEAVGPFTVKGFQRRVAAFDVIAVRESAARVSVRRS